MKILNCFLDNRYGGPQKRAYEVAERLQEDGIETIFLFNEKLKDSLPIKGYRCYTLKNLQCITRISFVKNGFLFFLRILPNLSRISYIINKENIDMVHVNGFLNVIPALAGRLKRKKVLWHLNDNIRLGKINRLFLFFVNIFATKIAVSSCNTGKNYFGKNEDCWRKTEILYAPVNINNFKRDYVGNNIGLEKIKSKFNIDNNTKVIGSIGNINPAKGFEYFIQAALQIKKRYKKAKFLIVGGMLHTQLGYWQKLHDLVSSLNLEENVIFTGYIKDIKKVLYVFDVFVLSSVSEACPITVLEAMAMEVPVVATDVGGVGEELQQGRIGEIVEAENSEDIARAVLGLLDRDKKDLDIKLEKGRERIEKVFSVNKIANKHKKLYKSMM
jgi:glycosyltransferase involved in cell wall biosynthesis